MRPGANEPALAVLSEADRRMKPAGAARWRRSIRWGTGVALLAFTPKCLLCALAYVGLGAALGLTGPELCGGSPRFGPGWPAVIWLLCAAAAALFAWRAVARKSAPIRPNGRATGARRHAADNELTVQSSSPLAR